MLVGHMDGLSMFVAQRHDLFMFVAHWNDRFMLVGHLGDLLMLVAQRGDLLMLGGYLDANKEHIVTNVAINGFLDDPLIAAPIDVIELFNVMVLALLVTQSVTPRNDCFTPAWQWRFGARDNCKSGIGLKESFFPEAMLCKPLGSIHRKRLGTPQRMGSKGI